MKLAGAIVFLWLGTASWFVAFHPGGIAGTGTNADGTPQPAASFKDVLLYFSKALTDQAGSKDTTTGTGG